MLRFFEVIILLGFVDSYMMFFYFNLHRCETITSVDFVFKFIPAIFTKLGNEFFFVNLVFHRIYRKSTDILFSFAFGFPASWLGFIFISVFIERSNCFRFVEENDVAIYFHEADLILSIQFLGRFAKTVVVQYSDLFQ